MIPNACAAVVRCGSRHRVTTGAGLARTRLAWPTASTRGRCRIGDEDVRLVDLDDASADAFDAHQRFGRSEVAVGLPVRDDRLGESGPHSRELGRQVWPHRPC